MVGRSAAVGRPDLDACVGQSLPDLLEPGVRLLFVAINPGLWSVAVQAPFAHPANRFWPALFAGRLIDRPIRVTNGMSRADRDYLIQRGIGITSLLPTAQRPSTITPDQLRAGRRRLTDVAHRYGPRVVAICGLASYASAFGCREMVSPGKQKRSIGEAELWVVPNPSVTNPNASITDLGVACRAAAIAAGLIAAQGTPRCRGPRPPAG